MDILPSVTHEQTLVFTVEEAARLLKIGRTHCFRLVAEGTLPSVRLGRRVLVPRAALEALLERQAEASSA